MSPHSSPHRGQIQDLAKSTGYAPNMLQFEKWNLVKTVLLTILAMPQRRTRNLSRKLASFAKTETHNICNLFLLCCLSSMRVASHLIHPLPLSLNLLRNTFVVGDTDFRALLWTTSCDDRLGHKTSLWITDLLSNGIIGQGTILPTHHTRIKSHLGVHRLNSNLQKSEK